MPLPGSNATVTVEKLTQPKDAHGAKTDGAAEPGKTYTGEALIARPSRENLYRMTVEGDLSEIARDPGAWRITDNHGYVYAPTRATYRPPISRIGESEHTLIFAERQGDVDLEVT